MAITAPHENNKLIQFRNEVTIEYFRENKFTPYMGEDMTSIIRRLQDNKNGGEQVNCPLVGQLTGNGKSTGSLTGNEEDINNYGHRVYVDWARNAVKTNAAEKQKDDGLIFDQAKPLLSDWGKVLQRDEIVLALHALPSEGAPAGIGSDEGQRVNGILYADATAAEKNTYNTQNEDRLLFGNAVGNFSTVHATALANIDSTNDKFTAASVSLMKRRAKAASPRIKPYMVKSGAEWFVIFAGKWTFRDLKEDTTMQNANREARQREINPKVNPLFVDGDLLYDGCIIREIEEIDDLCTITGAGASSIDVAPVFLCGQSAMAMPWAKLPIPTGLDNTDYQFNEGCGIMMCYGITKLWQKWDGTNLKQWAVVTGYFSSVADA